MFHLNRTFSLIVIHAKKRNKLLIIIYESKKFLLDMIRLKIRLSSRILVRDISFSVSVRSVQFIFSTDQKSSRKDHIENWNGDIDGWRKGKKEWMREKEKSLFVFNWKDSFFINFKNIISWCFKLIYLIQQNWKKNRFIWLVPTPIPTADIEQIKNYIRNHANDRILLSTLPSNVKRKYTKDQYLQILHDMETDGDGVVTSSENSTGPKAVVFIKKRRIESVNLDGNKDDRSADWRS